MDWKERQEREKNAQEMREGHIVKAGKYLLTINAIQEWQVLYWLRRKGVPAYKQEELRQRILTKDS